MNGRAERVERFFEWPALVSALLVIPIVMIEESDVSQTLKTIGDVANWVTWGVFAAELGAMLAVVPNRWEWLRRHPIEVAIVVLTPPYLPSSLEAARALRLLRLLRLLRFRHLARGLFSLEGVSYAALLAAISVLAGGTAFTAIEEDRNEAVQGSWDGIWWCFTSMTTVGSDIQPVTSGGRVIGIVVILIGLAFIALLTGAIAMRFLEPAVEEFEREVEVAEEDLQDHVAEISRRLQLLDQAMKRRR